MKILQITNRIPWPLNDGGNIATYNITKYLNELGHKITLASLNTNKHYQDPTFLNSVADVHTFDINTDLSSWGLLKGFFSSKAYQRLSKVGSFCRCASHLF